MWVKPEIERFGARLADAAQPSMGSSMRMSSALQPLEGSVGGLGDILQRGASAWDGRKSKTAGLGGSQGLRESTGRRKTQKRGAGARSSSALGHLDAGIVRNEHTDRAVRNEHVDRARLISGAEDFLQRRDVLFSEQLRRLRAAPGHEGPAAPSPSSGHGGVSSEADAWKGYATNRLAIEGGERCVPPSSLLTRADLGVALPAPDPREERRAPWRHLARWSLPTSHSRSLLHPC